MLFETIRNNTPNFMLITLAYAKHHIENAKNIISYAYDFVVNPLIKTYHLVVETFSHAIKSSEKESGELPLAPDLPNSKKEKEDSDDETPFSKAPLSDSSSDDTPLPSTPQDTPAFHPNYPNLILVGSEEFDHLTKNKAAEKSLDTKDTSMFLEAIKR